MEKSDHDNIDVRELIEDLISLDLQIEAKNLCEERTYKNILL